ncbi:hypothetical protein BDW42DRAFT_192589 [Aspergillus taichungensis]|uniref:Uncharacterized protein n=1 Tax=Aspergillus taichungensis TaxID=482145 RepID=A0A2J5I048_9EURO|nr:hypothetical protein BDW42DRAFT_192589 [Aspergillus taichungensis]
MAEINLLISTTLGRILNQSHPSALSIHKALEERFQSSVERTHGPPSMRPALSFPALKLDYSWTIFDQEIISLVNLPWAFEDILVGGAGYGGRLPVGSSSSSSNDNTGFGPNPTDNTAGHML